VGEPLIRVVVGSVLFGVAAVAVGVALKPPAMHAGSADIGMRDEPSRISGTVHRNKFPLRAPIASSAPVGHVRLASLEPPHVGSDPVTSDQDLVTNDQDLLKTIPASAWWNESFDERFPGLVTQELPSDMDFLAPPDDDDGRTAIYDIAAHAVYLPDGRRLEAHSGLGSLRDNPDHVHVRMRGATPPNVYTLSLRKKLFHGVQAIRLTPVDESRMFGRDGMLAHSYMHGANGQSNGCVAFSNYPAFLNAFLQGEVTRLVVVERLESPLEPKSAARSAPEAAGSLADAADRSGQYAAADAH